MGDESKSERAAVSIDPLSLPKPASTLWPAYGECHNRPVLALSCPVGTFEVDLTLFGEGVPVSCIDANRRSYGWFPGIINRVVGDRADPDHDDGTYDYGVMFRHLRFLGKKAKSTFHVDPAPARKAIVLSIPCSRGGGGSNPDSRSSRR